MIAWMSQVPRNAALRQSPRFIDTGEPAADLIRRPCHRPQASVMTQSDLPSDASGHSAQLLEQLLQIARMSALEEMASGFAHELNQPIGAIATFAQAAGRMLERQPPMVEQAQEVLRHISQEAMNAGQGIRRIRKLFNDTAVARTDCSLAQIIEELRPILQLLTARAAVGFSVEMQSDLPQVNVDRLRIQHVLFTLVQNAVEACQDSNRPGQVTLRVDSDRYAVTTSICDTGSGVSEQARAQLFRPFFTTKRHGTGLGLASSRAIVESHEGSIGSEDLPGGGTRFWFRLPAAT